MRRCFVIMSFEKELDEVYGSAIREAAVNKGYICTRADSELGSHDVPDSVIKSLIGADVVIADLTHPKPNVYFELGIAYSICKPTICISQSFDLPFDVRNYRIIKYDLNQLRLLRLEIEDALAHIDAYSSNPVIRSGRTYFDQRAKIEENLDIIVKERKRAEEFANFTRPQRSDNTSVAEALIDRLRKIGFRRRKTVIAICGAGSIGKSTFSLLLRNRLRARLPDKSIEILPTDAYMMDRSERAWKNITGFDVHSHDLKKFEQDVRKLVDEGGTVLVRPYDHSTGKHGKEITIQSPDVLILEGIHSLHPPIDKWINYSVFIYAPKFIVKELKFLADFMFRGYTPETAFQHSEREYMDYEDHVYHYVKQAEDVIYVDGYWRYRLGDAEGEYRSDEARR